MSTSYCFVFPLVFRAGAPLLGRKICNMA